MTFHAEFLTGLGVCVSGARLPMRGLEPGALLTVLCTDPVSVIDIPHLVTQEGDRLVGQGRDDGVFSFTIEKGSA